ncbi:MAG: hypothetical protein Q9212_006644, partial [Teloschistes hypoglaucus]
MDTVFQTFHQAQSRFVGPLLATTLSPIPPKDDPTLLRRFHSDSNVFSIQSDIQKYIKARPSYLALAEANAWIDIYVAYWKALGGILRAETGHHRDDWAIKVYEAWKEILTLLIRGYSPTSGFEAWTMPCLYTVGKYLRVFAIKADEEQSKTSGQNGGPVKMDLDGLGDDVMDSVEKNKWLEDAARVINEVFRLCISDRLLLTYLIPTHLHTSHTLATPALLSTHSTLHHIFSHLLLAIRTGCLASFSTLMLTHESHYVRRRIYLSLERARDLCVRNLLRKVWLLQGGKDNTRVKVGTLAAGMRYSISPRTSDESRSVSVISEGMQAEMDAKMEDDEVECLIAGLIYK